MSQRPEQEALQVSLLLCALCAPPLSCSRQQHEALWCDHGVPEGGRILYGLYMDEASTAASTEANTRVRRCMACASSQREGGRIGQGGRIHYFNYSFGYQDTNTKIPRSVLWGDIICVLRPWLDCIDRHAYLLGFPCVLPMDELGKADAQGKSIT